MLLKKSFSVVLFLAFIISILSGCKENSTDPGQDYIYILDSISDSTTTYKFSYTNNRITSVSLYENSKCSVLVSFSYLDNLISVETIKRIDDNDFINFFKYDKYRRVDTIFQNTIINNDSLICYGFLKCIYNFENRIKKIEQYRNNKLTGTEEYVYDSNGNILERQFNLMTDIIKEKYEYDNHVNPLRFPSGMFNFGLAFSNNNVIKHKWEINGVVKGTSTFSYNYENNYPVEKRWITKSQNMPDKFYTKIFKYTKYSKF